jgi:HSP20 family molecular chaperone IbpA
MYRSAPRAAERLVISVVEIGYVRRSEISSHRRPPSFGSFERTFQVPGDVDTDKIKASFKKGMLAVTLPKSAEARRAEKRITVKTG